MHDIETRRRVNLTVAFVFAAVCTGSDDASLTQSLSHFLLPYLGVNSLSEAEWAEARSVEQRIASSASSSSSGGAEARVSHLPPSHLQARCSTCSPRSGLVVAELGVGGGRVASRVYEHVQRLYCFDIAEGMLQQAQESIARKHARQQPRQQQQQQSDATAKVDVAPNAASASPSAAAPAPVPSSTTAAVVAAAASSSSSSTSSSSSSSSLPGHVSFHLLVAAPAFPSRLHGLCDFVYCFDVLPHVDLHTIHAYFLSIKTLLRPNLTPAEEEQAKAQAQGKEQGQGKEKDASTPTTRPRPRVFLHTANLCAPLGWDRFSKQSRYSAGGFYFLTPDAVRQMARRTGYRIIQESVWNDPAPPTAAAAPSASSSASSASSSPPATNLYYQRDFLFVMEVI